MRKDGESSLLPIDPEIEKTCKRNRKEKQQRIEGATMAEERPLLDYVLPTTNGYRPAIVSPAIENRGFEIKTGMINMIQQNQFAGGPTEDPNEHLANFNELCGTFHIQNISVDAIRLRLFSFSLRDRAKIWLQSLPAGSITTWEELCAKFLAKFFPFEKTARLKNASTVSGNGRGSLCMRHGRALKKC